MVELQYLGHSFFSIKDHGEIILVDPVFNSTKSSAKKLNSIPAKQKDMKKISLILLTNEMEEHFDKKAVQKIASENGAIVVAHDYILRDLDLSRDLKKPIMPNMEIFLKGFKITTTTAHCPQSFCPTGYLIEASGKTIYHAGVTKLLDSFSNIDADVALLPMSNISMDVIDVVRAAKIIKPKTIIPMQYDIYGSGTFDPKELNKRIKESVLNSETVILKPGKKFKV